MRILRKAAVTLAIIVLLFVIVGLLLPTKRFLSRSITIHAPIHVVFEEVNTLKRWENWSPWRDIDLHAIIQYEGPDAGVGCTMTWASEHPKIGKGTQQIVVSEPYQRIDTNLDFVGWDGAVTAGWRFEEATEGETRVTWSNESDSKGNLLNKYMELIIYPQLGKNYERGLKNLKAHVERLYAQRQEMTEDNPSPTQERVKILE